MRWNMLLKIVWDNTKQKFSIPLTGLQHKVPPPQPGTLAPGTQAFRSRLPMMPFLPPDIYQLQGNIFPLKRDLVFAQPGLDFHPSSNVIHCPLKPIHTAILNSSCVPQCTQRINNLFPILIQRALYLYQAITTFYI